MISVVWMRRINALSRKLIRRIGTFLIPQMEEEVAGKGTPGEAYAMVSNHIVSIIRA